MIEAGETTTAVTVPIVDDQMNETDETLHLCLRTLSERRSAVLATGTIVDGDPLPTVSVSPATTVEYCATGNHIGSTLSFPVELSGPSGLKVNVHWQPSRELRRRGRDFVAQSRRLDRS